MRSQNWRKSEITEEELQEHGEGSGAMDKVELPKDVVFERKLTDPKLPSEAEIGVFFRKGHASYRSCCHICVRTMGMGYGAPKGG